MCQTLVGVKVVTKHNEDVQVARQDLKFGKPSVEITFSSQLNWLKDQCVEFRGAVSRMGPCICNYVFIITYIWF